MATPIRHSDLGLGLDGFRAENKLRDGSWLSLTNFDPLANGSIRKRVGFQRYAGLVPLRVKSVSRSGLALRFTLQDWVDHSSLRSRPIVVFGRVSAAMGGLTTTATAHTYGDFTATSTYIEVVGSASGVTSETAPELCVYGLDVSRYDAVSATAGSRPGWVHHLDTFRESSTSKVWPVCAMEGVFYAGRENGDLAATLQVTKSPYLRAVASGAQVLGPAFWSEAPPSALTRGHLVHAAAAGHVVPVVGAEWVDASSVVRFTVNDVVLGAGSLSAILRTNLDYLTVEQASHSALDGSHRVVASALVGTTLTIDCEVPAVVDSRHDDAAMGAFGAVWTDSLLGTGLALPPGALLNVPYGTRRQWVAADVNVAGNYFDSGAAHGFVEAEALVYYSASGTAIGGLVVGETYYAHVVSSTRLQLSDAPLGAPIDLTSQGTGTHTLQRPVDGHLWETKSSSGARFSFDGVDQLYVVAASAVVPGTWTGRVWRLRTPDGSATLGTVDLVEGDVLAVIGESTWPDSSKRPTVRNLYYNSNLDLTSIVPTGDGATALVTLAFGLTTDLSPGDWLLFAGSPHYSGDQRVAAVLSSTTFTIETALDAVAATGATLAAFGAALDEAVTLTDDALTSTTTLSPHRRWVPIERPPSVNGVLVASTTTRHLDSYAADEQPFVRSVLTADSLYLDNGYDEPQKYDGLHLTRAGLPPLQLIGHGGVSREAATTGGLVVNEDRGESVTGAGGGSVAGTRVTLDDAGAAHGYRLGDRVRLYVSGDVPPGEYPGEVKSGGEDTSVLTVVGPLTRVASSKEGSLYRELTLGYYARLNLIDRNGRTTASATTQVSDQLYGFGASAQGQLRLQRPLAFPGFDHSRLETQVFRRPLTGEPTFSLVQTLLTDWSTEAHHSLFRDVGQRASNGGGVGDPVVDALVGAERAPAWDLPPRAKVLTAADGVLVRGDVRSYPRWSIVFRDSLAAGLEGVDGARLNGAVVTFRQGGATSSTPNQTTIQAFEVVADPSTSQQVERCRVEIGVDETSFHLIALTGAFPTFAQGDWVYIAPSTFSFGGEPSPDQWTALMADLEYFGWFQVHAQNSSTEITILYKSRDELTVTSVDTATDTLTVSAAHGVPVGLAVPMSVYGTTVPAGTQSRRTYFAKATSATELRLYTDPNLSTLVDLTSAGTSVKLLFGAAYRSADSTSNLQCWWASNTARVPLPVSFPASEGAYDGWRTLAFQSVTQPKQYLNEVVKWLAHAVNSAQAAAVSTSGFRPWLYARAGEDYAPGELFVESPLDHGTTLPTVEVGLPSNPPLTFYVNGAAGVEDVRVDAKEERFPYRLVLSYPNYPEVVDAPYVQDASQSDSVVDVDPATGGSILAALPAFGDSVFGTGLKEQLVVVGKSTGTWYVVNVRTKAVQRLQTNGKGLSFPRSVVQTKNGVAFVGRQGVFKLNRSLEPVFLGQPLGRLWRSNVDVKDAVDTDLLCATCDTERNTLVFAYPSRHRDEDDQAQTNLTAFAYNFEREAENVASVQGAASSALEGLGSWTQYEWPTSVLGWANCEQDSLAASSAQRVYSRRRVGDASDYRDDSTAIEAVGVYKLLDFGALGLRKLLTSLLACFRSETPQTATTLEWASSTRLAFEPFDDFSLSTADDDALGQVVQATLHDVYLSAPSRKGDLFGLRASNGALDESAELTELVFFVEPLTSHGVTQANDEGSGS